MSPSGQNRGKKQSVEVYFWQYVECWINKNALLQTVFLAIFPTRRRYILHLY